MFEAVADPRGKQTRTFTSTSSIDGNGETVATTDVTETAFNDLKFFSAQFAKRYNWLTLRFGIIENTGGLGLNFHTLDDQLEFQLDAFDFDRRDPNNNFLSPRIRLSTSLSSIITFGYKVDGMTHSTQSSKRGTSVGCSGSTTKI